MSQHLSDSLLLHSTHVQVCHQIPLSTWDCPTCPMDVYGVSIGHPTLTDQTCPTALSSPPVQWTSMGRPLNSVTRLVPLSCPVHLSSPPVQWTSPLSHPVHCPTRSTCPMDIHGTSIGLPTLNDQACPTVLSSPPVQWISMGRPLDIQPSLTRLVPLSHPVHLFNGCPRDVYWTSHPH